MGVTDLGGRDTGGRRPATTGVVGAAGDLDVRPLPDTDRTPAGGRPASPRPRRRLPSREWWRRVSVLVLVVAMLAAGGLLATLSSQHNYGPPRRDVEIAGRVPATVYLPGDARSSAFDPGGAGREAPAVPDRPPVVVLVHGHSADRDMMSPLARTLARAGYAVVAMDLPGHGASRLPFSITPFGSEPDRFRADVRAVVDWLGDYPYVDGSRIALMGHSLGAAVVLDFAARDRRPVATVALSGSVGPYLAGDRPRNLLLLVGANEVGEIRDEVGVTFRQYTGVMPADGSTVGEPARGSALRYAEVAGADHLSILYVDAAVRAELSWLDSATGRTGGRVAGLDDPRLGTAAWYALCMLVLLAGLGFCAGRIAPTATPVPAAGLHWRLLALAAAAFAAVLLVSVGGQDGSTLTAFLGLEGGDAVLAYLAVVGGILLVARAVATGRRAGSVGPAESDGTGGSGRSARALLWRMAGDSRPLLGGGRRMLGAAAVAAAGSYVLLAPLGPVVHRLVPTPQRAVAAVIAAALALPFFLALEGLLRRGSVGVALLSSLAGRLLVVIMLGVGLAMSAFQAMVWLYLPAVAVLLVLFEVLASGIYAASREPRVAALAQAALLGWVVAVLVPWTG